MIYVYGFCDGSSVHTVAEYQQLFRTAECLLEFTRHCQIPVHFPAFALQPSVILIKTSMKKALFRLYRAVHVRVLEELQDVFVFSTLHAEGMYPYHVQRVQHLGPGDFAERMEFCKWLNASCQLHRYILFTDEAQFNRDGVNNTHNCHVWADGNPSPLWRGTFNNVLVSIL
jgi:hypothetical protein